MRDRVAVVLLTQDHCKLCQHAKDVLARVGRDVSLSVDEVDLNSVRGLALAARGGVLFPPGVFIDGEPFSYGRLSERKLRRELSRHAVR
ncbi:MAG: glutaredoxin family protein [Egibacteraceae bacterium]